MFVGISKSFNFHLSEVYFFKNCDDQGRIVLPKKSFICNFSEIHLFKGCDSKSTIVGPRKSFNFTCQTFIS